MAEPLTGVMLASKLLAATGSAISVAADLHGLGASRWIRALAQRFDDAPDETPVFLQAAWQAAVQATHGCVKQVFKNTNVSNNIRGEKVVWDLFVGAHQNVRRIASWNDAADLPLILEEQLMQSLTQALQRHIGANDFSEIGIAECIWGCYCAALRSAGFEQEPPKVIKEAFFGKRPEDGVWPWSKHFSLRIGEQLRDNIGFRAMFEEVHIAEISGGVESLISESRSMGVVLADLSGKIDLASAGIAKIEQQNEEILALLKSKINDPCPNMDIEIERLRMRSEIRIEDLNGWLQLALDRKDPLPSDALPRLLQQALTVDLPKFRQQVETYHLHASASLQSQVLLKDARQILQPQEGKQLDLQAVKDKLKALDEKFSVERTERRRQEDSELAELRVLRAEAERSSANYDVAADFMEQAIELNKDSPNANEWRNMVASNWASHGEFHPGNGYLEKAIFLWRELLEGEHDRSIRAFIQINIGSALGIIGERLVGDEARKIIRSSIECFDEAAAIFSMLEMAEDLVKAKGNLGSALSTLGEKTGGDEGIELLKQAIECFRDSVAFFQRMSMLPDVARMLNNLANSLSALSDRLYGVQSINFLREAMDCYNSALQICTEEEMPDHWAMFQLNLGNAYRELAEREVFARLDHLQKAMECFESALRVYRRENIPLRWATVKFSMGTMCLSKSEYLSGKLKMDALLEGMEYLKDSLSVIDHETTPLEWAGVQNNMGNALVDLSEHSEGEDVLIMLRKAEACYEKALEVFCVEKTSTEWGEIRFNLGRIRLTMSYFFIGDERLAALRSAFDCCNDFLVFSTGDVVNERRRIAMRVKVIAGQLLAQEG